MTRTILLFSVFMLGCGSHLPQPVVLSPVEKPCKVAEETLLDLECKDSKGELVGGETLRGVSFEQFCLDSIEEGSMSTAEATCLARLDSCDGIDVCGED